MVKIIPHNQIDKGLLTQIVEIKNLSWQYSFEDHLEWMDKNLKGSDLHLFLYENDEILAYVNLVDVAIESKGVLYPVLGIGNVCTRYKGSGAGKHLMKEVNFYLSRNNKTGLLFCKVHLVSFYLKQNWQLIPTTAHFSPEVRIMVYNLMIPDLDFKYDDRLF